MAYPNQRKLIDSNCRPPLDVPTFDEIRSRLVVLRDQGQSDSEEAKALEADLARRQRLPLSWRDVKDDRYGG